MLCLKKFLLINCSILEAFLNSAYCQLETFGSLDIKILFSIFDQTPQLIGLILIRGILYSYTVPYMHHCTFVNVKPEWPLHNSIPWKLLMDKHFL